MRAERQWKCRSAPQSEDLELRLSSSTIAFCSAISSARFAFIDPAARSKGGFFSARIASRVCPGGQSVATCPPAPWRSWIAGTALLAIGRSTIRTRSVGTSVRFAASNAAALIHVADDLVDRAVPSERAAAP